VIGSRSATGRNKMIHPRAIYAKEYTESTTL
jgi:hypothetical protein